MTKRLLTSVIGAAVAACAMGVTPLWLRDVKISPDGSRIAFTYRGDIYTVATGGGEARRITTHPGYEAVPVWSPDGRWIAFQSDRHGNMDVYVMPSEGGAARRLTYNSAAETPEAFTPDGSAVVFSAWLQDPVESSLHPTSRLTELYSVDIAGGQPRQLLATPAQMVDYSPDGSWMVYQDVKGIEDEWRKHHTSSVTRDVWRYDPATGRHTNLTSRGGEDRNPVISPDGSKIYFLSERDGTTMNVYSMDSSDPSRVERLTDFAVHPVRFLSVAADGTLALAYDGEIYTLRPGGAPTKVAIDVVADWDNPVVKLPIKSGATSVAVSPDGKEVALTARGEVIVSSVEYPTTRVITSTPQAESQVAWGSDARSIVYASDRSGVNNLYTATLTRREDPNFANATSIEERALMPDDNVERTHPKYSPDGKKLAYVEDRNRLMVMDVASGAVKQLTDSTVYPERNYGLTYAWSPDSRWIVMEAIISGREPYTDILLVDTSTGRQVPVTETGYFDGNPSWAMDGQAIVFMSERYGMRNHASWGSLYDAMIVFLNQDAYDRYKLSKEDYELKKEVEKSAKAKPKSATASTDKKDKKGKKAEKAEKADEAEKADKGAVAPTVVEEDGLQDRIARLTPNSTDMVDVWMNPKGEKIYYVSTKEKGAELWSRSVRDPKSTLVTSLSDSKVSLIPSADGKKLFVAGPKVIKVMGVDDEKVKDVSYSATLRIDPAAERAYMMRDAARQERERFYDKGMHGVDWDAMTEAYARFLPHISNNHDFAEMLSEWLGELNVSHTGARYRPSASRADQTASLGLLYDLSYDGPGLKVAEVVKGGPLARSTSRVKPGVVIEAIGDSILSGAVDYASALCDIAGRKTLLRLLDPSTGTRWDEVVIPITSSAMNSLLYRRWVEARAADVDRWSGGRLGYVHIPSMNDASYRKVYADLMGRYAKREGVVVDIRWNGGGRLHEDVEVLLSGEKYLTQVIRGQETCDMPSRRWNKPSIMVIAEPCYSNAHGTPWVYKHQGIGKLVGMPVPGTMTSVNWVTMQDPTLLYGIPVIGYRTAEGTYLENSQLEPDIKVANTPEDVVKGEDAQLRRAVDELLLQLDNKR